MSARVQIVLAALLTLGFILGVVFVAGQPQFVTLYSRLDHTESNEITVWLDDQNIPHKLHDGGQTVAVPVQYIQRARVELSGLGLPKTQGIVPGFELFSDRDLITNRWLQDVDFMRALQGELQRQLNEFEFVRQSFVFIREAPEQLFVSEQQPSQATVTLDISRPLTKSQIKALLHVVSSFGGANLSPDNITLTTTEGALLHSPTVDKFASIAGEKLEMQDDAERLREEKVSSAFRLLGVAAIVRVSAVMDWTSEERTEKKVFEGTVISSEDVSETTSSGQAPPEGAPGSLANIPEGLGGGGQSITTSETKDLIENFEPSESLTRTSTQPGTVTAYRVSAFIEGGYLPAKDEAGEETGEMEYVPLTDTQKADYKDFIAEAVGAGVQAADIVVLDHPRKIDRLAAAHVVPTAAGVQWWRSKVLQLGVQGVLILAAFFMLRVFMRRALVLPTVEEEEVVEIPAATAEDMRRRDVASEVERLSREEPATVAALLRSWMAEEE